VSVGQLTETLFDSAFRTSLVAFRPELVLCATILALLLVRMVAAGWKKGPFYVTLAGSALAFYYTLAPDGAQMPQEIFSGMLIYDSFSVYLRALLLMFVVLYTVFIQVTGVPSRDTQGEFYVLILGAVLGMCLMVSANHMLIVFLGFEMASVPSYALAGFLKHRRSSGEAALKYAVFGAGAAGVMLYGISLLVGALGSAHLPTMALQLADLLQSAPGSDRIMVLLLGGLMVMVGLAFKLSAVPFHFWAPDVFEGATAEVAAFLSIASKAAALALLVRLTFGLGYDDVAAVSVALGPARHYMVGLIGLLAVITCTFGNLAAYGQTNIKRLLAYSTIAHAGYMMMAVAAAVALLDNPVMGPSQAQVAVASLGFYLAVYLFMNLGAFAVVAFLRDALGSEQIDDYAGLVHRSPGLTICMALILFSLVGLPPLAGFAAKFTIFYALYDARLLALLAIGVLNTVLSLFYYLRVVKVMTFGPEPEGRPATAAVPLWSAAGGYCMLLTLPVIILGVAWNFLFDWARLAALMLTQ